MKLSLTSFWPFFLASLAGVSAAMVFLAGCYRDPPRPVVHWKVNPGEKYRIRLELDSPKAHGFTKISGEALYRVENFQSCLLQVFMLGPTPQLQTLPLEVKRIGEGVFATEAYKSPLVDEDYHGIGICKWKFDGINILIKKGASRLVIPAGKFDAYPAKTEIICNEQYGLCGNYDENSLKMSRHFPISKGILTIEEE